MSNAMKRILLLTVMLALVIGSSATFSLNLRSVRASDVEGVTFDRQKAFLKPGYRFERESVNSATVLKTSNLARIQTGTITCVGQRSRSCELSLSGFNAQCSGGCYFVGVRGGVRAP
jgi:hypothetical protein